MRLVSAVRIRRPQFERASAVLAVRVLAWWSGAVCTRCPVCELAPVCLKKAQNRGITETAPCLAGSSGGRSGLSPRAKVAVCDRRFGWALFGWLANRTRSRRVEFWACARDSARACACCSVPGVGMAHAQHARTSAGFGGVLRGVRARFRSARVCFAPLSMHAPPQGAPLCQKAALNYADMTRTATHKFPV